MRLIDAEELIKCLDYCAWNNATDVVTEQPTVFDFDTAVARLEAHIKYNKVCEKQFKHSSMSFIFKAQAQTYQTALDIVRSCMKSAELPDNWKNQTMNRFERVE